jgi:glycosyltransferase involved in cell wall biosynthesis
MNARKRLGLPVDKHIILHVGSEECRKNVPVLIEAFSRLRKKLPDSILIRVGKRMAKTQKIIRTLELENSILYFQDVPEKDLSLFYNSADLFVFPSYYEGFGMPVLEAMSSGIPVLSTDVSSIPEIVGNSGVIVDPFDVDAFTYWMNKLLTDRNLLEEFAEKSINRSMMFDWTKCAKETLLVYQDVLEN